MAEAAVHVASIKGGGRSVLGGIQEAEALAVNTRGGDMTIQSLGDVDSQLRRSLYRNLACQLAICRRAVCALLLDSM